jgi:hypothetical protein
MTRRPASDEITGGGKPRPAAGRRFFDATADFEASRWCIGAGTRLGTGAAHLSLRKNLPPATTIMGSNHCLESTPAERLTAPFSQPCQRPDTAVTLALFARLLQDINEGDQTYRQGSLAKSCRLMPPLLPCNRRFSRHGNSRKSVR